MNGYNLFMRSNCIAFEWSRYFYEYYHWQPEPEAAVACSRDFDLQPN